MKKRARAEEKEKEKMERLMKNGSEVWRNGEEEKKRTKSSLC